MIKIPKEEFKSRIKTIQEEMVKEGKEEQPLSLQKAIL